MVFTFIKKRRVTNILRLFALSLGATIFVGSTFLIAPAQSNEDTAVSLIFSEPYLKKLEHPAAIAYQYSHATSTPDAYGAPFEESVTVKVDAPTLEGGFNSVAIWMKDESREYKLGPFENTSGNPVVMMFLERDLRQMRSKVGGAPVYFRNTIRRAFRDGAEVDDVNVQVKGVSVAAKRITIKPFVDEQGIGRFGKFRGKVFETIVTDAVPGGIYTMRSFIPDGQNKDGTLVVNQLQYQDAAE